MGGPGSGRKPSRLHAVLEEAGAITLRGSLRGLHVDLPLPDAEFFLPSQGRPFLATTASVTLKRWLSGHLAAELVYSASSPHFCVRDCAVEVLLGKDKKRRGAWLFHCPGGELPCGRRTRTLYVHPHTGELGCRTCLKLAYRSTLTHPKITEEDWEEVKVASDGDLDSDVATRFPQPDKEFQLRTLLYFANRPLAKQGGELPT